MNELNSREGLDMNKYASTHSSLSSTNEELFSAPIDINQDFMPSQLNFGSLLSSLPENFQKMATAVLQSIQEPQENVSPAEDNPSPTPAGSEVSGAIPVNCILFYCWE